jgi:hypothetical protein
MKSLFDKKTKDREFLLGDLVLKWEARKEDAIKHGKFDPIWSGPYRILALEGKNAWLLENLDGDIQSNLVRSIQNFSLGRKKCLVIRKLGWRHS